VTDELKLRRDLRDAKANLLAAEEQAAPLNHLVDIRRAEVRVLQAELRLLVAQKAAPTRNDIRDQRIRESVQLRAQGKTIPEIAQGWGLSVSVTRQIIQLGARRQLSGYYEHR
jgi:hypothetical protein